MKYFGIILILISIVSFSGFLTSCSYNPVVTDSWHLVWEDNFNGSRLDTSKWNVLMREHSKHNELQYYVPDEVYVEDGNLRIRSRVRKYGDMEYTSGRLDTKGKYAPLRA